MVWSQARASWAAWWAKASAWILTQHNAVHINQSLTLKWVRDSLHLRIMQALGCADCRWRASDQEPFVSIWTLIAPHQSALSDTLDWAAGSSGIRHIPFTFWNLLVFMCDMLQGRHFKTSSVIYGHWWISFWSQFGRNNFTCSRKASLHSHQPTPKPGPTWSAWQPSYFREAGLLKRFKRLCFLLDEYGQEFLGADRQGQDVSVFSFEL